MGDLANGPAASSAQPSAIQSKDLRSGWAISPKDPAATHAPSNAAVQATTWPPIAARAWEATPGLEAGRSDPAVTGGCPAESDFDAGSFTAHSAPSETHL